MIVVLGVLGYYDLGIAAINNYMSLIAVIVPSRPQKAKIIRGNGIGRVAPSNTAYFAR